MNVFIKSRKMMDPLLKGMLLSLAPVSELRGGIPLAIIQGANVWAAFILCVIANIIIAPILFLFLDYLHKHLIKYHFYKKTFNAFLRGIRKRKESVERRYETWGILALVLFTATPLPVTGVWTATLIAWLLNLKRSRSILAIALGALIAGIFITLITVIAKGLIRL